MKIQGYTPIHGTPATTRKRKAGSAGGSDFSSYLDEADANNESSSASSLSEAAPTAPVNPFLAMQEMSDEEVSRRKVVQHGENLLRQLEQLRNALLTGELSPALLERIGNQLQAKRAQTVDPHLREIIDEIELRAAVELAKYESLHG